MTAPMDIPILQHITALLEERDRRQTERFEAQEKALDRLALQYGADKALQNEWRGVITDSYKNFVTLASFETLDRDVRELRDTVKGITASQAGGTERSGKLVQALGVVISLLVLFGLVTALLAKG